MIKGQRRPLLYKKRRLVFLYLFRDFDKGTVDAGFEYTVLQPDAGSKVVCKAATLNAKGLRRDRFLVDSSNRSIVNLPGRYICYWVDGKKDYEPIYDRMYRKENPETYVHVSREARSELKFDEEGLEKKAENLVTSPRRYHEVFVRLFSF